MNFEDHFSKHAASYAQFRPNYPDALFAYLAEHAPARALAWDCATGSGQAAQSLAAYFDEVVATDASAEQIGQARPHERIRYLVEPAEATSLRDHSVDLVTVAVAVHWFDLERFYAEARRVLKPGGVIAVWTYHRAVTKPALQTAITRLERDTLEGYWPERIHYLQNDYKTLPFPFEEWQAPSFSIRVEWTFTQLLGFINSWSAVRFFQEQHGKHPLQASWEAFVAAWGDIDQPLTIDWPLNLRVGRSQPI